MAFFGGPRAPRFSVPVLQGDPRTDAELHRAMLTAINHVRHVTSLFNIQSYQAWAEYEEARAEILRREEERRAVSERKTLSPDFPEEMPGRMRLSGPLHG